jgi:hypothetical protein
MAKKIFIVSSGKAYDEGKNLAGLQIQRRELQEAVGLGEQRCARGASDQAADR